MFRRHLCTSLLSDKTHHAKVGYCYDQMGKLTYLQTQNKNQLKKFKINTKHDTIYRTLNTEHTVYKIFLRYPYRRINWQTLQAKHYTAIISQKAATLKMDAYKNMYSKNEAILIIYENIFITHTRARTDYMAGARY